LIAQIDELKNEDNLVEDIFIDNNAWLCIKTKNIITEVLNDGTRREIGKMLFKIDLNILMSSGNIIPDNLSFLKIHNMTRIVYNSEMSFECGHVEEGGNPCLGNVFDELFEAMTNRDLIMICNILIKFVKNPDLDDAWGKAGMYFPEVVA
jgi:hypothetical protein